MHRTRSQNLPIPICRVPAETIYVADEFAVPELPLGTTAVHLGFDANTPDAQLINPIELLAIRRNSNHVRSFELQTIDEQPIHQGFDTTLKGAEWSRPGLRWEQPRSREVVDTLYFGGVQREDAEAALEASHLFEEWGVHGERIQRIDAPEVLAYQGELMPVPKVIGRMVNASDPDWRWKYKRHLRGEGRQPVTMIRTAPTDVRLADLHDTFDKDLNRRRIQVGMDSIGERNPAYSGMQATDPTDVYNFFCEALPYMHAVELARINEHGYQQLFPHPGNILIDGGVVDLDGVRPGSQHIALYRDPVVRGCISASTTVDLVTPYSKVSASFGRGFYKGSKD